MTRSDVYNAVKLELDKTSSLTLPAFLNEEIDYMFDKAHRQIIEEKYNQYLKGNDFGKLQDELKYLLVHAEDVSITATADTDLGRSKYYNVELAAVDNDMLNNMIVAVYAESTTKQLEDGTSQASVWQKCKRITYNEIEKYLSTYSNTPYFDQPVYFVSNSNSTDTTNLVIITDYFTTGLGVDVRITYLRIPTELGALASDSTTYPDLPEHLENNVIERTAFLMLENIESPRVETDSQIINPNN